MVNIAPFRGYRPANKIVKQVACVPYDVITTAEAKKEAKDNPNSFLRIIKPEICLSSDVSYDDASVYAMGTQQWKEFKGNEVFVQDSLPCLYVYEQSVDGRSQTGIISATSAEDYLNGKIKIHEKTRPKKEDDRTKHIESLNAQTGPIFMIHRHSENIEKIVIDIKNSDPEYDFQTNDGVSHRFWVANDATLLSKLVEAFCNLDLYIADGHHRVAASARVCQSRKKANAGHIGDEPYNFFLGVLVPENEVQILPYNRVVSTLGEMSPTTFISEIQKSFTVEEAITDPTPQKIHTIGMYCDNKWVQLSLKPEYICQEGAVEGLDASILQTHILSKILGINDPRTDERLQFVGGSKQVKEYEEIVNAQKDGAAFLLHPVAVHQLIAVADAGQLMPPKSTWFHPKLLSGLVVKEI